MPKKISTNDIKLISDLIRHRDQYIRCAENYDLTQDCLRQDQFQGNDFAEGDCDLFRR